MCLSGWAHIYTIVEGNRCSLELFVSCMFVFGCLFNAFAFLGFALRCHSHCALLTSFLLTNRLTDWLIDWLIDWCYLASVELQRVASTLLHLVPTARQFLRAQHVCRGRRRELPQVSRDSGTWGEGTTSCQTHQETRPQTKECVSGFDIRAQK